MSVYNAHSDQELLLLIGENSERAMTEIFDRYWDKLLAVALNRLDNLEEAEECVQDVFLKLWKLRATIELKYTLYTYLSAAVRYRVIDLLDKQYRKLQYAPEMLSEMQNETSSALSSDRYLLEKELIEQIEASVKLLPEKCQMVYRMSREDGKSHKQIAAQLNISEKTVQAHLTKAIKDIRNNLPVVIPAALTWFCFNDFHDRL